MSDGKEIPVVYECRKCWIIIPYIKYPHNCPGDFNNNEDLETFLEEIKGLQVSVDEAPEPKILELIPNQMQDDEQYQAFHIREADEEVPDGVEPIQVYEVGPGEYRAVVDIIAMDEEV